LIDLLLQNLLSELDEIEVLLNDLIDASTIKHFINEPETGIVFISPPYYWGELDNKGLIKQAKVLKAFNFWFELVEFIFFDKLNAIKNEIMELRNFILNKWIQGTEGDFSLLASIKKAKEIVKSKFKKYRKHINWLASCGYEGLILIPDTNSLINNPEIQSYGKSFGTNKYTVVFIPAASAQLVDLKIKHKDQNFRKKINSIIRYIKGYRKQENLHEGVNIYKSITVKMISYDPKVEKVLHWLDKDIPDDRIIASSLELQRQNADTKVVLVTSDINLQNKAEATRLPYIETPINP